MSSENSTDQGELTLRSSRGDTHQPAGDVMPPTYLAPAMDPRTARANDYSGRADCTEPNRSSSAAKNSRSMGGAASFMSSCPTNLKAS